MKIRWAVAAGAVVAGGGLLVLPGLASAHTLNASAACGEGLSVQVFQYPEGSTTTVTIDGEVIAVRDGAVDETFPLGDPTQEHTWRVEVDGFDGDQFDKSESGAVEACVEEPPTTEPPTTEPPTTEPPTTEPPTTDPCLEEVIVGEGEAAPTVAAGTCVVAAAAGPAPAAPAPPAAPASPAPQAQAQTLPETGSTSTGLVIAAAATLAAGGAMWMVSRRRAAA